MLLKMLKMKEKTKLTQLKKRELPNHLAIIPDGNRRYAEKEGINFHSAYLQGAEKARDIARWARKIGIKYLTFYSLSMENLEKRSSRELEFLFNIFEEKLSGLLNDKEIHKTKTRVHIMGNRSRLPQNLQEIIQKVEEATKDYDKYHLIFLLGYSGRKEIIHAVKKIVEEKRKPEEINSKVFSSYLYMGNDGIPDPDLVVRTSGEIRISNFLLWEIAYSELFFTEKLWPELTFEDIIQAVEAYQDRKRRYGK